MHRFVGCLRAYEEEEESGDEKSSHHAGWDGCGRVGGCLDGMRRGVKKYGCRTVVCG